MLSQSDLIHYVHRMALLPCPNVGPAHVAATERKPAPIIITISANCGDGSVTVSFDMLHIVSLTPNCCSRPCQGQIPQDSLGLMLWALVKLEMNNDKR